MRREAAHLLMVGGLSACGGGNVRGPEPGVAEGLPCPDGLLLHTAGPAAPLSSGFSRRQRLVRRCFLEKPLLCCVIAPHVGEAWLRLTSAKRATARRARCSATWPPRHPRNQPTVTPSRAPSA